eukprot:gene12891-14126_t
MGRYSAKPKVETKAAKASGTHLRIHYKHTREIGNAIKGRDLKNAQEYLENVLQFKDAIPVTKYTGGIGRHAIGKKYKAPGDKVSWPQKATRTFLDLLKNVESNAEAKGLEVDKLVVSHVNCNQAPKMRRRTYRAHGRINAYMSSPAHIQLIVEEKQEEVAKAEEPTAARLSRKQIAQGRGKSVKVGGDV